MQGNVATFCILAKRIEVARNPNQSGNAVKEFL